VAELWSYGSLLEGKARLAERIPTYSYLNKHMIRAKILTNPDYEWIGTIFSSSG